ncbi:MAG: alpha-L-fucosidase [Defluviitaleaceae bacterium]|nr:alpha-L-fucosidase [Defluviitaleaceae bacterium]
MKPSKQQLDFLSWEMGAFFHFGIRTFYEGHRDWDGKIMPLEGFNPTQLDCEQWIKTVYDAGLKYAILVCKHHDGFANWPSKYSDYHVGLTPWKGGNGDVVREFVDACHKYGIKVGLYYSPAEANFKDREAKEYDDYFINQISELLDGTYGKVDYLWFDGNGSAGHEFDKPRIIKAIRGHQPEILIFNMWDPDVRWVGNEGGMAGVLNRNLSTQIEFDDRDLSSIPMDEISFLPSECDFMMRNHNWFYSEYDVHTAKSVEELIGLYYLSVGCGSNFLINIGPDRRGLLPGVDAKRLVDFGNAIRERFANPIPGTVAVREDGLNITLDGSPFVNTLIFEEDLTNGEMIEEFAVYMTSYIIYRPVCLYTGKTVGNKRIITFPTVRARDLHVKVLNSRGEYILKNLQAFYIK